MLEINALIKEAMPLPVLSVEEKVAANGIRMIAIQLDVTGVANASEKDATVYLVFKRTEDMSDPILLGQKIRVAAATARNELRRIA